VTLSTVHAAKGGEWPVVFVAGLEDGLLPHLSPGAGRGEDEERRLAYVALSRAQVLLYLVFAQRRRIVSDGLVDRVEPRRPSRFLLGLPRELIERIDRAATS
jgi:DNA helicase-2/ATP-dependent DNA helicase PcrA